MTLAVSGALALSAISTEFGGKAELSLSAYYRGAGRVPCVGSPNLGIPTSGAISFSAFRGSARTTVVDYEMIGGGGGGDNPSTYDSSGAGGFGGAAGTRRTGSITADYGVEVDVTIGVRGKGAPAGYPGGDAAPGYARLTWDGKSAVFTSSGSATIN